MKSEHYSESASKLQITKLTSFKCDINTYSDTDGFIMHPTATSLFH